jgi:hypothetical protein
MILGVNAIGAEGARAASPRLARLTDLCLLQKGIGDEGARRARRHPRQAPLGPERLLTEGVMHLDAVCCTALALLGRCPRPAPGDHPPRLGPCPRLAVAGVTPVARPG